MFMKIFNGHAILAILPHVAECYATLLGDRKGSNLLPKMVMLLTLSK